MTIEHLICSVVTNGRFSSADTLIKSARRDNFLGYLAAFALMALFVTAGGLAWMRLQGDSTLSVVNLVLCLVFAAFYWAVTADFWDAYIGKSTQLASVGEKVRMTTVGFAKAGATGDGLFVEAKDNALSIFYEGRTQVKGCELTGVRTEGITLSADQVLDLRRRLPELASEEERLVLGRLLS